jgi:hypothetical protein
MFHRRRRTLSSRIRGNLISILQRLAAVCHHCLGLEYFCTANAFIPARVPLCPQCSFAVRQLSLLASRT